MYYLLNFDDESTQDIPDKDQIMLHFFNNATKEIIECLDIVYEYTPDDTTLFELGV